MTTQGECSLRMHILNLGFGYFRSSSSIWSSTCAGRYTWRIPNRATQPSGTYASTREPCCETVLHQAPAWRTTQLEITICDFKKSTRSILIKWPGEGSDGWRGTN